MKKQFFRVKQLADQTFLRADKSEILNYSELHKADQRIEFLRTALGSIIKKLAPNGPVNELDKIIKKSFEYQLGTTFSEESRQGQECTLFQHVLREAGVIEQQLAREYAEHEMKVEELVYAPFQSVLENELPNVLKHKNNLRKYCLDKDSASNRYHATRKETVKDEMEEADAKVEQSRDALATEMFNVLAKENEFSEYILQLLKLQRGYHESALKNLETIIPQLEKSIGDSSVRRVFGTSLKEHLRITGKKIAYPLEICISAISEYGMQEEGLFRVAAGSSKVKRLKASIDSGCFSDLIREYRDVHVLASILKLYLRELPEPLLTFHLNKEWMDAMQVPESQRLEVVRSIIAKLPQENKDNLAYLFQFFNKLVRHPENKMSSSNVAIVLSPNLLWVKDDNESVNMGNCVVVNTLVELLVKEAEVLFPQDVSRYVVPPKFIQEDEISLSSRNDLDNVSFTMSMDSPKPNTRKKKSAPVPPNSMSKSLDSDAFKEKNNHDFKTKTVVEKATVGINTDAVLLKKEKSKEKLNKSPEVRLKSADVPLKSPESQVKATEVHFDQKSKPPVKEQLQTSDASHKYKTVVSYQVNQKPVPEKRSLDPEIQAVQDQLRKPDVSNRPGKPEVPARPVSLSRKPPLDLEKTHCSVYSLADKQQPSIISLQTRSESINSRCESLILEKEKFLGLDSPQLDSKSEPKAGEAKVNAELDKDKDKDKDQKMKNMTFSANNMGKPVAAVRYSLDPNNKTKSIERLIVRDDKPGVEDKQDWKFSHLRTRSEGGFIDLNSGIGHGHVVHQTLSKPTEPPPPPPEKK